MDYTLYNKGFFLHLVTDYLFFNNFIDRNYLNSISYDDFCSDLYYSYQAIDNYLLTKYQIDYSIYSRKVINKMLQTLKTNTKKNVQNIIPLPKLDDFIENVSNINIENYAKKIILNKKNILP